MLLTFPTVGAGGSEWHLRQARVDKWLALFPGLDVLGESRKALAWVLADPKRRKTASGMGRFLTSWLTRACDRQRPGPPADFFATNDRRTAGNAEAIAEGAAYLKGILK